MKKYRSLGWSNDDLGWSEIGSKIDEIMKITMLCCFFIFRFVLQPTSNQPFSTSECVYFIISVKSLIPVQSILFWAILELKSSFEVYGYISEKVASNSENKPKICWYQVFKNPLSVNFKSWFQPKDGSN